MHNALDQTDWFRTLPSQGYCAVFLGKTLLSLCISPPRCISFLTKSKCRAKFPRAGTLKKWNGLLSRSWISLIVLWTSRYYCAIIEYSFSVAENVKAVDFIGSWSLDNFLTTYHPGCMHQPSWLYWDAFQPSSTSVFHRVTLLFRPYQPYLCIHREEKAKLVQ